MKTSLMLRVRTWLLAGLFVFSDAVASEEFYSITQLNAPGSPYAGMHGALDSADHIFRTDNIADKLAATKRVRMLARPLIQDGKVRWEKTARAVEVPEEEFRPVLKLATDFSNYGDQTMCAFEIGAILLIGESNGKAEYVVQACFKCHDIMVERRPTGTQTEVESMRLGMSPELESAIFALAKKMFPKDEELQKFQLADRKRATGPPKASPLLEIPASLR